jgi:hypothetical protein
MSYSFGDGSGGDEGGGEAVADESIEEAAFGIGDQQIAIKRDGHGVVLIEGAATKFELQ